MTMLPSTWTIATGEDLFCSIRGVSYDKSEATNVPAEGFVPILRANNISDGHIITDDLVYVPSRYVSADQYLQDGDLVIAASSGSRSVVGKAARANRDHKRFAFGAFCTVARPRCSEFSLWLSCYMNSRSYRQYVERVALGIHINNLRGSDLRAMPIRLAPLAEQRRIVTKIESLCAKSKHTRDQLNRVLRLVEKYKQAILAAAFRGELTKSCRARPGEGVATSSEAPWPIPSEWKWLTVAGVGEVSLGRQRSPKDHSGPQMRRYVRAANITWRGWSLTDVKQMNFNDNEFARFRLRVGDVLLNEGSGSAREVGKPAIWKGDIPDCCFQNTLLCVRPTACGSEFLYYYFLFCALTELFVSSTQGVNIYHIGKDGLARFAVPLPPKREQDEIVRLIDKAFTWIERIAGDARNARKLIGHLDQAVLAKAFRGQLVPQDTNDEPASVLLESIRSDRASGAALPRSKSKPRRSLRI